jgi:hypothetical protein
MKEKQYLSSGEVAKALGVLVKTVQQWDQAGLITVVRMIDNQRRIPTSITRLTRGIGQPRCVIYARVSSSRQEPLAEMTEKGFSPSQAAVSLDRAVRGPGFNPCISIFGLLYENRSLVP